ARARRYHIRDRVAHRRRACAHIGLRARSRDRPGWDGHRLSRQGSPPEADGRDQAAPPGARLPLRDPHALPARGRDGGAAVAPAHRPDLRGRRGGRPRLLRDGLHRRRQPRQAAARSRAAAGRRGAPHPGRGLRRAGLRPCARRGAPRHQAGQHPPRQRRGPRAGDRLRHRARDHRGERRAADRHRDGDRHAGVHEPRAERRGPRDRRPLRPVLAGRGRLPDAGRRAAVPGDQHARDAGEAPLRAPRPGRAAPSGHAAGPGDDRHAAAREGAGQPVHRSRGAGAGAAGRAAGDARLVRDHPAAAGAPRAHPAGPLPAAGAR
ncbi:MAG: Serine/threonine protein kinase, partial [uncultured Solirubrobacterales bacterium]